MAWSLDAKNNGGNKASERNTGRTEKDKFNRIKQFHFNDENT